MRPTYLFLSALLLSIGAHAQTNPAITAWLRNTTGVTGRYYLTGGTAPITDTTQANVQLVQYSASYAYISATGIPTYATGPYAIGTVTKALNNSYVFKIPLNPTPATTHTTVGMGATAVFINGTVAFAARDAATYTI